MTELRQKPTSSRHIPMTNHTAPLDLLRQHRKASFKNEVPILCDDDYLVDPRTGTPYCLGASDKPLRRALLDLIAATTTSQTKRIRDAARRATITVIDEYRKSEEELKAYLARHPHESPL